MAQNQGNLSVHRLGRAGLSVLASANPLEVLMACVEYMKTREQEETRRLEINAKVQVALETLRAEREVLDRYFDLVSPNDESSYLDSMTTLRRRLMHGIQRQWWQP